jgi:hypothetical protein
MRKIIIRLTETSSTRLVEVAAASDVDSLEDNFVKMKDLSRKQSKKIFALRRSGDEKGAEELRKKVIEFDKKLGQLQQKIAKLKDIPTYAVGVKASNKQRGDEEKEKRKRESAYKEDTSIPKKGKGRIFSVDVDKGNKAEFWYVRAVDQESAEKIIKNTTKLKGGNLKSTPADRENMLDDEVRATNLKMNVPHLSDFDD